MIAQSPATAPDSQTSIWETDTFVIPLHDRYLLYAPLHDTAAILDDRALHLLQSSLRGEPQAPLTGHLAQLAETLQTTVNIPAPRTGPVIPSALGILSTRACNLACNYCGFLPEAGQPTMSLDMTAQVVNWYMDQAAAYDIHQAEIHFFGGEPFYADEVVMLAVHLGRRRAAEIGCGLRFEVATNGTFSPALAHWIADNIDTVVLSFDGPEDIQNKHRPRQGQQGSYAAVARNAHILSEGTTALALRACVTSDTVQRMPEIAAWFCETFHPEAVGFEPLQPTQWSEASQLYPPDPWEFVEQFIKSAEILESYGVQPVYASTNIQNKHITFCPVGKDFIIAGPDGQLNACYLREYEWEARDIDLTLGQFADGDANFDPQQVDFARSLNVHNKPLCADCFCKWHCAGGCHVNHVLGAEYDRLCIQSRVITLYNILKALGQEHMIESMLQNKDTLKNFVFQKTDTFGGMG